MNLGDLPDVISVQELAAVLRCGRNQAYRLVSTGAVWSVKVGRGYRVPKAAVVAFLDGDGGPGHGAPDP